MDIANRSFIIRTVLWVYVLCKRIGISYMLVALYGFSYYLRTQLPQEKVRWLGIALYPNEVKQLDDLDALMGEDKPARVTWRFTAQGMAALARLGDVCRVLRVVKHIDKTHTFMPACRVTVALFLYMRLKPWLTVHEVKAVVVTSDYSPDGAALTSAAGGLGIPRIYMPHALPSLHIPGRSMLSYDLYLFDSEAMAERFAKISPLTGEVIYRGVRGKHLGLRLSGLAATRPRVGIFLSSGTRLAALKETIAALARFNPSAILVRGHPVDFSNPDFSALSAVPGVCISKHTTLEEDTLACDIIIAGNSTVILECLRLGTPTVYYGALDMIPYDYNGFVAAGLVQDIAPVETFDMNSVARFFDINWLSHMAYFDAAYGKDSTVLAQHLRTSLMALLKGGL